MPNSIRLLLFSVSTLILGCANDTNYKKGLEFYETGKYAEAKTMLNLVKPNTHYYENASAYISKIDSILLTNKINKLLEADSALLNYKRMSYPKSIQDLTIEVAYFSLIGKTINDVKILKLPENQKHVESLDSMLIKIQIEQFPKLREEYGTVLGKTLWKNDVDVSISGDDSKNIEFTSTLFSSNANIDAFHNKIKKSLADFRFNRAIYKWRKHDSDPEILFISSPEDSYIRVL